MSLVSRGFGGNNALLVRGLGQNPPSVSMAAYQNSNVWYPDLWGTYTPGDANDPEYATMTPESANEFNARSLLISLPRGTVLPPRSLDRLEAMLRLMKPLGVNIRVRVLDGATLLEVIDVNED